jgi:hypothetical protein
MSVPFVPDTFNCARRQLIGLLPVLAYFGFMYSNPKKKPSCLAIP